MSKENFFKKEECRSNPRFCTRMPFQQLWVKWFLFVFTLRARADPDANLEKRGGYN
jgi:hypothetical protein